MVRKLTRLKREIRAREAAIDQQRRVVAARYDGLNAHYRCRLSSPTVLISSFATGIVVGTLARRPRRAKGAEDASSHSRLSPLWSVARTIAVPALLQILRTKAAGLINTPGP